MTKQKRNQKGKVKAAEKTNPNPSPSGLGSVMPTGQEFPLETLTGTPAPTVTTEEGVTVQVGQKDQAQAQAQTQGTPEERSLHPQLGTVFESNVTKYKGRKTEFLTLPMNLVKQPRYPFKGDKSQKVRITLAEDGSRIIVERL